MKLLYQRIGTVMKVCTARCYNAVPDSRCACICKGRVHAVGEKAALEIVSEYYIRRKTDPTVSVTRRAERAIRRMEEKDAQA